MERPAPDDDGVDAGSVFPYHLAQVCLHCQLAGGPAEVRGGHPSRPGCDGGPVGDSPVLGGLPCLYCFVDGPGRRDVAADFQRFGALAVVCPGLQLWAGVCPSGGGAGAR